MVNKIRFILITSLSISTASATIINVPADSSTIQGGLNGAVEGDTVLVQPGTYYENIVWPDVDGIKLLSAGDSSTTTIDGGASGAVITIYPTTVTISGNTEIQGFKIMNGLNTIHGGGLAINNASPLLANLMITANVVVGSELAGGGISVIGGSPTLVDLNVFGNTAFGGGGLAFQQSNADLTNTTISSNTASFGGGLAIVEGSLTISEVTVTSNNGSAEGGGIYIDESTTTLTSVVVSANTSYYGGGIFVYGSPTLTNVDIIGNSASRGGGFYLDEGDPALTNVTVTENGAESGGGLYITYYSAPTLSDMVISTNIATMNGAGLFVENSAPELSGVTVNFNGAGAAGGGIYCTNSNLTFDQQIRSNIFYNNAEGGAGKDLYASFSTPSTIHVVVDTFTVLYPTEVYASPLANFTFDILNAQIEQVSVDLYVDPSAGDDSQSGHSAAEPLKTISTALATIVAGSSNPRTIYLANGTYSASTNNEQFPLNMVDYVSLVGETESGVILNGEGQNGLLVLNNNEGVAMENLTLTGGFAYSGGGGIRCSYSELNLVNVTISGNHAATSFGGGIYIEHSNPTFSGVTVTDNYSDAAGGGIYMNISTPIFDSNNRCNIFLNTAPSGADLYADMESSTIAVVVDTFTVIEPTDEYAFPIYYFTFDILNSKTEPPGASTLYVDPVEGDDMFDGSSDAMSLRTITQALSMISADALDRGTIHLANGRYAPMSNGEEFPLYLAEYVTISGESESGVILDAEGLSGVIEIEMVEGITVENLSITGGAASGMGGGIYSFQSSPTLRNLTITGNSGHFGGGGIYIAEGNPSLIDLTVKDNWTDFQGGGIYISGGSPTLMNVTITGNMAELGGGLHIASASPIFDPLIRCNIFNNSVNVNGDNGMDVAGWFDTPNTIHVVVDTFTVLNPTEEYVSPLDNFTFDIFNARQTIAIGDQYTPMPAVYALNQNYPNPFNPRSTIRFDLPMASHLSIIVYDILGREVARLIDGPMEAGFHQVDWNGQNYTSGIYIARLVTPEYSKSIKMILLK